MYNLTKRQHFRCFHHLKILALSDAQEINVKAFRQSTSKINLSY